MKVNIILSLNKKQEKGDTGNSIFVQMNTKQLTLYSVFVRDLKEMQVWARQARDTEKPVQTHER